MFESGSTAFIIYNEEMNDIMKINEPIEESSLLIKSVGKTNKKEDFSECYYAL